MGGVGGGISISRFSLPLLHERLVWFMLCIGAIHLSLCIGGDGAGSGKSCLETEKKALLLLKHDFGSSNELVSSSWSGDDCCKWTGVSCNNQTGHVVKLKLSNINGNRSKLNPSLAILKHLTYLDLTNNNFGGDRIPEFIGSLQNLEHLDLSYANFSGTIPRQIGNLSRLVFLGLSHNNLGFLDVSYNNNLTTDNLHWLSNLSRLQDLEMSGVSIMSSSDDWFHILNRLPSLVSLYLSGCGITRLPTTIPLAILKHLTELDLSDNNFGGDHIPEFIGSLQNLEHLDLSYANFSGTIPRQIGNLSRLDYLGLSNNSLTTDNLHWLSNLSRLHELYMSGVSIMSSSDDWFHILNGLPSLWSLDLSGCGITRLPATIPHLNFTNLYTLDLSLNNFASKLPPWLFQIKSLVGLYLFDCNFYGLIPEAIGNITSLGDLRMNDNNFSGQIPESLGNLSKLVHVSLENNNISGEIPESLGNLSMLLVVELSNNNISGEIPRTLGSLCNLQDLDLSKNKIGGQITGFIKHHLSQCKMSIFILMLLNDNRIGGYLPAQLGQLKNLAIADLSSNNFEGSLPPLSPNLGFLNLSRNSLSGPIPCGIDGIEFLYLSHNHLKGSIPLSVCQMETLKVLDVSNNDLSGEIPLQCWKNTAGMLSMDLSKNHFSGNIPNSFGSMVLLKSLHLSKNALSGKIPPSLKNCRELRTLDLEGNDLSGHIPPWIGVKLSSLQVLSLRSNKFHGDIPATLSYLTSLQVLDLAGNKLSGNMLLNFSNLRAMTMVEKAITPLFAFNDTKNDYASHDSYENLFIVTKGVEEEYSRTLSLVTSIDLSDNNFTGKISEGLTRLYGLHFLNLSRNQLEGNIPRNIGHLQSLESLDLSGNRISGEIPSSMTNMTFLSKLNLSNNHLCGEIPTSNQFQTFDQSSYLGNPELCGTPLLKPCHVRESFKAPNHEEEYQNEYEMIWFFVGLASGFVVGFWGFLGVVLIKKARRFAYLRLIDKMCDSLYVILARYSSKM